MEARQDPKIPPQLESLLVPWINEGKFMNIFLKCQLSTLPSGYEYFIRMRSKDHFDRCPDPVGNSFYYPLDSYWTTQASHSFTTPLKIFQFFEARQILQFNVFIRECSNQNRVKDQPQPQAIEYCSAEAKFSQICQQKLVPLVLKSKGGTEIGSLSCSIIQLVGYDDDENKISLDFNLKLSSSEAKYMRSSQLKIYGNGNKRDEIIEIFSQDASPDLSKNSLELNVTYQLENIPLTSIFGNINKQYCWFYLSFEGKNEQSEKQSINLVFPVHKSTLLTSKQGDSIKIKENYDEVKPALLNSLPKFTISSASYFLSNIEVQEKITLEKFIHAGIKFNLIVGIDFTRSNGSNKVRDYSLHTSTQLDKNPYIKALKVVADILIKFDNDLLVPMYGFGGQPKLPHYQLKRTSYCFPIIGSEQYPELHELPGMMAAYLNIIDNKVFLDGPTYFKPLLQLARKTASQGQKESDKNYYILLIITDGIINDNEQTAEEIKLCVDLPISIVIVGVGEENFDDMDYLNDIEDVGRDLVSFVRMENYDETQEHAFKSSVLEELPRQVTQYYEIKDIKPNQMVTRFEEPSFEDRQGQEEWIKINDYKEAILQKYKPEITPYLSQS